MLVRELGSCTIFQVSKRIAGGSYATIRAAFDALERDGVVRHMNGTGPARRYELAQKDDGASC